MAAVRDDPDGRVNARQQVRERDHREREQRVREGELHDLTEPEPVDWTQPLAAPETADEAGTARGR